MGILGLVAALFGLDQYLKQKIENQSPDSFPRMMEGTGGMIKLYRNHNSGFSGRSRSWCACFPSALPARRPGFSAFS